MFLFLVPLLIGFFFNAASAFTTYYSRLLGERWGRITCVVLRDILGIPVWVTGYIMAARAPSTTLYQPNFLTAILAGFLILAGGVVILLGLKSLKWRAPAPSVQDTLVAHGIYSYIRHPIYSGMLLELIGLFLYIPTITVLVACGLGSIWVIIQARLEEIDLVQRLPAYQETMRQVPRFVPRRKQPSA
jgi:protein-S-isoprenylcysteine O-methyltransferase Ste14